MRGSWREFTLYWANLWWHSRRIQGTSLLATTLIVTVMLLTHEPAVDAKDTAFINVLDFNVSGSTFSTIASTMTGSRTIEVKEIGDFKPGQGVILKGGMIHYPEAYIWSGKHDRASLKNEIQIRGYDGSGNNGWTVFLIDIEDTSPAFRWSDNMGRTWKASKVPVTYDWQPLSRGVEIQFARRDWHPGDVITFHARHSLFTSIESVHGDLITLKDTPNRTTDNALLVHEDSSALQLAIDAGIRQKKNIFIPSGCYRLSKGLIITNAWGSRIEGADGVNTVLDISEGSGACITLFKGHEATIKNLKLIGHTGATGFVSSVRTSGGYSIWTMFLKLCRALEIRGTESVYVENVNASKMTAECFYSRGSGRTGKDKHGNYSRSITFFRCSVTDCGFNAFNTNDMSENVNILYCRAEDVGNCFWEGPGRFVRIIGNYAKDTGVCAVGNMFHRYNHLNRLGVAQTIIADNTFEGASKNRVGIRVAHGASQVVIRNNLFINYGSTAIQLSARDRAEFNAPTKDDSFKSSFPPNNVVIDGNIIDLTYDKEQALPRDGIDIGIADVVVANNLIYVRKSQKGTTGIRIRETATNLNIHDNQIKNCQEGIVAQHVLGEVGLVEGNKSFLRKGANLPLEWANSHSYRNWRIAWIKGKKTEEFSTIDHWDPLTFQFHLKKPFSFRAGDKFHIFPDQANWNVHDNTITGCVTPIFLDSYGSETSLIKDNLIYLGGVKDHSIAIKTTGSFELVGNRIVGYEE